ncbi:cytochrome P450 [Amycolatopsis sp. SID8362]|uniref:cytochrome P450 n=1 Tax=Amycolatopsis sp. SID8362 TaxID=2690346 RepID=UPI00136C5C28|nr:cytochrome P450 [Amycolatopsis sp. SID8362]NBH07577.1 cytochrome P450 [Amycolatopsis sp. SID8362]NED44273.1 cytochrome P450 [Amycolatopsis sp. SID8362]
MIGKALAAAAVATAPAWLPARVVALRMKIFALVNGQETVTIPGERVGVEDFRRVYADPAANGRSRGAALSDLFWYWLAPGPEVHQEHLEPGPRYDEVAKCTRHILIRSKKDSEELARRVAAHVLDGVEPGLVRLRDEMMPIWAELYYELVFEEPCPPEARDLIVAHADDVVSALKCVRPRNMRRRARLTKYLRRRLADVPHPLPQSLTPAEQAYYLQGTFFNTAVVQMSEAMAHLLMIIAKSPDTQRRLAEHPDDDAYLDRVIDDGLRRFPLFGIAHRISTADIELADLTIPAGTVLCFSYPEFAAQSGKDDFIPFGVAQNRACPARGLAPPTMRVVTREVLRRFSLASTAGHTRSIPNRGPALLTPRGARRKRFPLAWLAVRDRWEDVWRSFAQLVFGTYMVLDARRQALCTTYFAGGNR